MTIAVPSFSDLRVKRHEVLDADFFDRRSKQLADSLARIKEEVESVSLASDTLIQLGLTRIDEILTPALVRVQQASELGFLVGGSTTELTLAEDEDFTFEITEATRDLFTPTPFLHITRAAAGTQDEYAVARLVDYSRTNGGLWVTILEVHGLSGAHNDWVVSCGSGIGKAVQDASVQVTADAAQVAGDRAFIEGIVDEIQAGPVISVAGKTGAVALELGDIPNLVTSLAGKAANSHGHIIGDVTGLQAALDAKGPAVHTHPQADITNLVTDLAGKAAASHTHIIADVTGLQTTIDGINSSLAGKAAASHTHPTSQVTGLDTALAGKAATSHTHAQADVTGLVTALAGKAATSHTHAQADVTNLVTDLAAKQTIGVQDIVTYTQSRTLQLSDKGKIVEMNMPGANTVTIPPDVFAVKDRIDVVQYGAGQTSFVAGVGVTLRSEDGFLKIGRRYGAVSLYQRAANEWLLIGNLSA